MNTPLIDITIYRPYVNIWQGVVSKQAYINPDDNTNTFPVTDACERSAKIMGDDTVRLIFKLSRRITFEAFSYIEYGGQTFFLKEAYRPKPYGSFTENGNTEADYYEYDMLFVSVANMLDKHICYRHVVVGNSEWNEPEVNINGTLETMYVVIMGSIKQAALRMPQGLYYTYLLKSIYDNGVTDNGTEVAEAVKLTSGTPLQTFSLSAVSIQDACTTIANGYEETEWYITENQSATDSLPSLTMHFTKYDNADESTLQLSDYTYENTLANRILRPYVTGGLLSCEYAQEWTGVPEVIVPFGSDRNMSRQKGQDELTKMIVTYGRRLRLEPETHYTFTDDEGVEQSVTTDENGGVINPNISTGIEQVKFYEDVYPQCHFRVTFVKEDIKYIDGEKQPRYTIEGEAIDKDGNVIPKATLAENGMFPISIIEAETLSVTFESGLLAGREFEITNKTTKDKGVREYSLRFIIVADGDIQEGTLIPSGNFIPKIGDTFALFNMDMPDSYIEQAQHDLAKEAWKELKALELTRPEVRCVSDPTNFDKYDISLGRRIELHSEIFHNGNAFLSRVISFTHSLTEPEDVTFSVASAIMQGRLSSIESAIGENVQSIGGLDQRATNLSRRGWHDASEMAEMLNALVAQMMLVGVDKNQFAFSSSIECINGNIVAGVDHFSHIKVGNGTLQHTQEPWISQHNGTWYIEATDNLSKDADGADIDPVLPYYLYATLQDESDIAQLALYTAEQSMRDNCEQDEHYLLLGILSSEFEDGTTAYRVFNRSNGYTQIAGGTITTEQIQDAGRNLIIDFQSNPPRIIARNEAQIIGNITFTSPQGSEVDLSKYLGNLEETIDNLEVGGRNLAIYSTARVVNMTKDGNYGFTQIIADTKPMFNLRIDDYHGQSNYKTYVNNEIISTPGTYSFNITLKADTSVLRIKHNGSARDVESIFTFSETVKSGEEIVVSITFTNVTQGEFAWKNVMIERGNKATDWYPALEDLEAYSDRQSGGENLYDRGDPTGTIPYYSTDSFLLSAVESGKTYVGSYQQASGWAQFSCLILKSGVTPPTASFSYMDVYYTYGLNNIDGVYKWGEPIPVNGNDRRVYALVGITYENAKRLFKAGGRVDNECLVFDFTPVEGLEYYFKGIMLQEGERATGYQAATKHLTDAMENGSTEVVGGIVVTNVLMLKDEKGNVVAGMSGVVGTADNPENVLMWGGGNYAEAFYAAINDYKKNAAGTLITTLLKKDGTGKIGVFRIGEDKVVVQTDDGMVVIDDNLGITCQRAGDAEPVIVVTPQELSNIEDLKDETVNVSNSDRNIANGENVTNGAEDSNFILRTETKTFSITVGNSTELTLAGGVSFNILNQTQGVTVWDEQSADINGVPQNAGIYAEIHNSQGSIVVSGVLNGSARNELKATLPNAGTYTISYYCRIFCDTTGSGRFSASIQITSSSLTYKYTYKEAKKKTMIAYKGLFSYQGETEYFYYKDGVGLECKMGDKKLKITKDGIYMDGLPTTSTNLQKGSIYKNGSQLCIV